MTVAVVVVVDAIEILRPAYGSVDLGYACSVEFPSCVHVNIIESVAIPTVEYARLIPLVVALTNVWIPVYVDGIESKTTASKVLVVTFDMLNHLPLG